MDRAKMRARTFILPTMKVRTLIVGKMKVLSRGFAGRGSLLFFFFFFLRFCIINLCILSLNMATP